MPDPLLIHMTADNSLTDHVLLLGLGNHYGLIAGATGIGKTITLQVPAEYFSAIGLPGFNSDVKGDLTGISQSGSGVLESILGGRK